MNKRADPAAPEADGIDRQLAGRAPMDRFDPTRSVVPSVVRQAIDEQRPIMTIVVSADIRRSASVLKESIDIPHYANVLADFVGEFRTVLAFHGGWFDKFTGDGFLGYWLPTGTLAEQMDAVFDFSFAVMNNFRTYYYESFVSNMRNVPAGIGLSIGVDAGECYLLPVAGDLTVVGSPMVGAVRMCDACQPYQMLLNSYPGAQMLEGAKNKTGKLSRELSYRISPQTVATKEYPSGQSAYQVDFLRRGKSAFGADSDADAPRD